MALLILFAGGVLFDSGARFAEGRGPPITAMKNHTVLKNYYVLPCCLLLLNLINNIVAYKAEEIDEPFLRTTVVIFLVLAGSALVAYVFAPMIVKIVQSLHKGSRNGAGELGEICFLLLLGAGVFWLYYQTTIHGVASILPEEWRNPKG